MWYAIEYAYGSHVVNNGNRADRVLEFTAKRLRDAFVAGGPSDLNAPGVRLPADARHPLVRKAAWKDDGDREGWKELADQRVMFAPALRKFYATIISYDWPEADHYKWVATAPEREIVSWVVDVEKAAYSEE